MRIIIMEIYNYFITLNQLDDSHHTHKNELTIWANKVQHLTKKTVCNITLKLYTINLVGTSNLSGSPSFITGVHNRIQICTVNY